MKKLEKEWLVIGAGALGLASAQALLQAGFAVTVLDRGEVGREASWAGGGILSPLCPWDYAEAVTRLAQRSMGQFEAWAQRLHADTGIDPEYRRCGMRVLPPFDAQIAQQWCEAHGMPYAIDGDSIFLPEIAQVRNPRLLRALRAQVERLGGRFIEQCAVQDIAVEDGRVRLLRTTRGDFGADDYIVTAGAWSGALLGGHARNVDIRPVRGQMLLYKFDAPPLPHILLQGDLYFIPRRDGCLLVGSTLEESGFDKSTTAEARAMLSRRAGGLLPALRDMPVVRHWAGLRPASPGNIPTIGRHPELENLYLNSGHFRYGVTMAPASVELLLNEIAGRPQPFDVAPYRWR